MEVVAFSNGEEALRWWRAANPRPCLLIIDVRLPDGNGLDLFQKMSDGAPCGPQPAVLVLSAHGDPRLPHLCQRAGANAFLDKLSGPDKFIATVQELVAEKAPIRA
jgi:DNA-binding NarL/FixJ family response regulator